MTQECQLRIKWGYCSLSCETKELHFYYAGILKNICAQKYFIDSVKYNYNIFCALLQLNDIEWLYDDVYV
jgi:hypothetical protein